MIGYYVHHHGIGHLMRFLAISRELRSPVTGLGSMPGPAGWHGPWVRLERDDAADPTDIAARDVTAHGTLHWAPLHDAGLAGRTAQLTAWLAEARPSLVVVDVSVEVTALTRLAGVPVVVVAMPGVRSDRAHRLAYDMAHALLAPWPAGAHTTGWPDEWRRKLWAVGGISRFDARVPPDGTTAPTSTRRTEPLRVLLVWGAGGTDVGASDVAAARAATPGWEWVECSPRSPSPDLWADLRSADVVVTHAGQGAVADVAAARRPAVVVPQQRPFDEQGATAAAVERLGAGVGLRRWPSDPSDWPGLLHRALATGGHGWAQWSSGHGAAAAAGRLDALAGTRRDAPTDPTQVPTRVPS
ncbi:glycosyltransferase [Terrabacter terrigena]|uniref:Glycosyltransferase n=1 Tax=Terrabacter terrigena TaxID=574718 RepID=A0ABW3MX20_9MICO